MPPSKQVQVRTTLPFPLPPITSWDDLHTSRLTIRAPRASDVTALHELRTQPEVMEFSAEGRVDRNLEETGSKLETFLPPNDRSTYNFLAFNKGTGDFIGTGGIRQTSYWFGWPEVGFSIKREAWGQGYATEFMTALVESWWKLPRRDADVEVDAESVHLAGRGAGDSVVVEQLSAMVEEKNLPSRRVLEKCGFRPFKEWKEVDNREGFNDREVLLIGYAHSPHTAGKT